MFFVAGSMVGQQLYQVSNIGGVFSIVVVVIWIQICVLIFSMLLTERIRKELANFTFYLAQILKHKFPQGKVKLV